MGKSKILKNKDTGELDYLTIVRLPIDIFDDEIENNNENINDLIKYKVYEIIYTYMNGIYLMDYLKSLNVLDSERYLKNILGVNTSNSKKLVDNLRKEKNIDISMTDILSSLDKIPLKYLNEILNVETVYIITKLFKIMNEINFENTLLNTIYSHFFTQELIEEIYLECLEEKFISFDRFVQFVERNRLFEIGIDTSEKLKPFDIVGLDTLKDKYKVGNYIIVELD